MIQNFTCIASLNNFWRISQIISVGGKSTNFAILRAICHCWSRKSILTDTFSVTYLPKWIPSRQLQTAQCALLWIGLLRIEIQFKIQGHFSFRVRSVISKFDKVRYFWVLNFRYQSVDFLYRSPRKKHRRHTEKEILRKDSGLFIHSCSSSPLFTTI